MKRSDVKQAFCGLATRSTLMLFGLVIGLSIGLGMQYAVAQNNSGATCENAVCVPAGDAAQWRAGNLVLNTSQRYANGLLVPYGNVGLGTLHPQAKLEVIGNAILGGKVVIGAASSEELAGADQPLTVKGEIASDGLCIKGVCIDDWNDLSSLSSSAPTPTRGDYCPVFATGSSNNCLSDPNFSQIKKTCCPNGTITSCAAGTGGTYIAGNGCGTTATPAPTPTTPNQAQEWKSCLVFSGANAATGASCMNAPGMSTIKAFCCPKGTITACRETAFSGVEIQGANCNLPPDPAPERHWGPVSVTPQAWVPYVNLLLVSGKEQPVGAVCGSSLQPITNTWFANNTGTDCSHSPSLPADCRQNCCAKVDILSQTCQ